MREFMKRIMIAHPSVACANRRTSVPAGGTIANSRLRPLRDWML
jgi:hypothetical protein